MFKAQEFFKNIFENLPEKTIKIIVIIGFGLILLIVAYDFSSVFKNEKDNSNDVVLSDYNREVSEIVGAIGGVESSKVKVMITFKDEDKKSGSSRSVVGVAIVTPAASDVDVKARIVDAVSKALGIGTNRVSVVY